MSLLDQMATITKAHAYDTVAVPQIQELKEENKRLAEALKGFIHSVEHEGVIQGRVVDAVTNAKEALKNRKPYNL